MHPEIRSEKEETCSVCGMHLVSLQKDSIEIKKDDYMALWVVFGVIGMTVASLGYKDALVGMFSWHMIMMYFMAGMFLVFSTFKLLDLQGFKQGYATYDLIATKFPFWGYIYPFIELGLGLLYLVGISTLELNIFTLVLMTMNGLGVLIKITKKEHFQCACLGTFLKVPLTKVSLIEDFGMASMALFMILL
jgi:hypothetical protein